MNRLHEILGFSSSYLLFKSLLLNALSELLVFRIFFILSFFKYFKAVFPPCSQLIVSEKLSKGRLNKTCNV